VAFSLRTTRSRVRLGAITSCASLAFIVVFGSMCALAFRPRDQDAVNPIPPAIGADGTAAFAAAMVWNLSTREPGTFWMVLVVAGLVLGVELLYFERERLPDSVVGAGKTAASELESAEADVEAISGDLKDDADSKAG
jgi:hypothetical protein